MNDVITLSQLITRLARVTDTDTNTARRFVRSLFAAVEEQLMAGESVTVKGIGTFRPNGDALAGDSVLFIPDEELAAAVNAPFAMFEPVEVADGVVFDEPAAPEAEDVAEAPAEAVVAEAPAELPSEVPAEVPAEAEPVPEVAEVREEPAEVEEEVEEAPEAEEAPTVPPIAPAPAAPAPAAPVEPAVKRYLFPEEEEGELPPAEPLRAPERKSNRMWVWILLIVLGGGIFGYLLAMLDSDDDFETTPVEFADETSAADSLTAGGATFEEVAIEELAATAPVADASPATPAELVDTHEQAPAPAVEPEQKPAAEKPVYDTVTGTNYLAKMARKYYGRSSYWVFIYQANTDVLDNPDRIKPGTRVLIPPKSSFAEDTDAATQKKADRIRAELDKKYKK